MMQIPQVFLGSPSKVRREMAKLVLTLEKGATLDEDDFGGMIDVGSYPGCLILFEEATGRKVKGEQFHCYAFVAAVKSAWALGKVDDAARAKWIRWSLEKPWRFLGILGGNGSHYFWELSKPEQDVYVRAGQRYAGLFDAVGERFIGNGDVPSLYSRCSSGVVDLMLSKGPVPIHPNRAGAFTTAVDNFLALDR